MVLLGSIGACLFMHGIHKYIKLTTKYNKLSIVSETPYNLEKCIYLHKEKVIDCMDDYGNRKFTFLENIITTKDTNIYGMDKQDNVKKIYYKLYLYGERDGPEFNVYGISDNKDNLINGITEYNIEYYIIMNIIGIGVGLILYDIQYDIKSLD